jgi:hypothetical protein
MRKWMLSILAGGAVALASSAVQAAPLGAATKGMDVAPLSAIELAHHRPGHKMKHHDRGRHLGWTRGKHKGWHKHRHGHGQHHH